MICDLLQNLNFWSAVFGLAGTIFIFFFGLPPKIDRDGHICLRTEQEDEKEKQKAKIYILASYVGLILLAISFFLQLINSFNV